MFSKKTNVISLILLLIFTLTGTVALASGSMKSPWLKKPVLGYLLWTSDSKIEKDVSKFKATLDLSDDEFNNINKLQKMRWIF